MYFDNNNNEGKLAINPYQYIHKDEGIALLIPILPLPVIVCMMPLINYISFFTSSFIYLASVHKTEP